MPNEYREHMELALEAARKAGAHLKAHFGARQPVEYKGEIDLITARDRESQDMIYDVLHRRFPDSALLGEEDGAVPAPADSQWLIDPLDGTTNYAHGLPLFCVSLAFREHGQTRVGVVFNPMLGEMFRAVRGQGAFLDANRLTVSREGDLGRSLLATGFPYDIRRSPARSLDLFGHFVGRGRAVRRCGAAALDLAYTAAGRFDGFWEMKLSPWDTAAGALLVEEAGGRITDFSGAPFDPFGRECLASNGLIHGDMLEILAPANA